MKQQPTNQSPFDYVKRLDPVAARGVNAEVVQELEKSFKAAIVARVKFENSMTRDMLLDGDILLPPIDALATALELAYRRLGTLHTLAGKYPGVSPEDGIARTIQTSTGTFPVQPTADALVKAFAENVRDYAMLNINSPQR